MTHRILVLAASSTPVGRLREALAGRGSPEGFEIRVVAPATKISRLDWLTNAEDDARQAAAEHADEVAAAIPAEVDQAAVGDSDPVQAVEDELRTFEADEVVIVRGAPEDESWLEDDLVEAVRERVSLPVSQVALGPESVSD